jgi:hypothetical protein
MALHGAKKNSSRLMKFSNEVRKLSVAHQEL